MSTFAAFEDFKQAYETVDRTLLFRDIYNLGLITKFVCALKVIYKHVECAVKVNNYMTELFNLNLGLQQGCVLPPILFNIFINSLVTELKALDIGIDINGNKNRNCVICR